MAEDGRPRADEDGWLEADQPGRPFKAQIRERPRSVLGAIALALLIVGVVVAASARSVSTTRPGQSPKPQGSAAWFQPLHYVTSSTSLILPMEWC